MGGRGGDVGRGRGGNGEEVSNEIVRNLEWKHAMFQRFSNLNIQVRDVLNAAAHPPSTSPHDPTGHMSMCVAYHVKGIYSQRYGRGCNHAPHTDAQDANLVQWCTSNYVLP